jgi:hypothetical protein
MNEAESIVPRFPLLMKEGINGRLELMIFNSLLFSLFIRARNATGTLPQNL